MVRILLVINDHLDPRRETFGRLFTGVGAEVFFAYCNSTIWVQLNASGEMGAHLSDDQIPIRVDAALVHGSDFDSCWLPIEKRFAGSRMNVFVFDSPGNPAARKGAISILRTTVPLDLRAKHAEEICHFATTNSDCWPSCCWHAAQQLCALDILCQGWLIAHGQLEHGGRKTSLPEGSARTKLATDSPEWWLRGQNISSIESIESALIEQGVPVASAEKVVNLFRAVTSPGANMPEAVGQLRATIKDLLV